MDGWLPSANWAHIWTFAPLTPSGFLPSFLDGLIGKARVEKQHGSHVCLGLAKSMYRSQSKVSICTLYIVYTVPFCGESPSMQSLEFYVWFCVRF